MVMVAAEYQIINLMAAVLEALGVVDFDCGWCRRAFVLAFCACLLCLPFVLSLPGRGRGSLVMRRRRGALQDTRGAACALGVHAL